MQLQEIFVILCASSLIVYRNDIIVQDVLFLEFVAGKKTIFSGLGYNKDNGLKFVSSQQPGMSVMFSPATLVFHK